jgi:template-activating factor I
LKKVYKYSPGADSKNDSPDANGITDAMVDFSWERDVEGQVSSTHDAHLG